MRVLVLTIFLAVSLFSFFLKYLTYSRLGDPVPENVKDIFDEDGYRKNQSYLMANLKFSVVNGLVGMAVMLVFLLMNVHSFLFNYISSFTVDFYLTSFFIILVPQVISTVIDTGFDIYDTFVIEERFGFNKNYS